MVHQTALGTRLLDNPVWAALDGPHAGFAERSEMGVPPAEGWGRVGRAARYPADVYAFAALADPADPAAWADLHRLLGPATTARIKGVDGVPDGWDVVGGGQGVQLVDTHLRAEPDPEAVRLGPDDVPDILDLVARTRPGPYLARTVHLGTYLGIRHRGRLIALAGERSEMGVPPGRRLGEAPPARLDRDQRRLHRPRPPRPGPGHPAGPGRRCGHQGTRRDPVPARRRPQHHRDPAVRVARLHPAPPHDHPSGAHPRNRRRGAGVVTGDEARAGGTGGRDVCIPYLRLHIDLQRVAGALCRP